MILDGLKNILKVADPESLKDICYKIEECQALDVIESLQSHENMSIYNAAYEIIEMYFSDVS